MPRVQSHSEYIVRTAASKFEAGENSDRREALKLPDPQQVLLEVQNYIGLFEAVEGYYALAILQQLVIGRKDIDFRILQGQLADIEFGQYVPARPMPAELP